MKLTKYNLTHRHYYIDEKMNFQGMYTDKAYNNVPNLYHFYVDDEDITADIEALVEDIHYITNKEKMLLTLKYGSEFGSTINYKE